MEGREVAACGVTSLPHRWRSQHESARAGFTGAHSLLRSSHPLRTPTCASPPQPDHRPDRELYSFGLAIYQRRVQSLPHELKATISVDYDSPSSEESLVCP